jgi:hypothetical protein
LIEHRADEKMAIQYRIEFEYLDSTKHLIDTYDDEYTKRAIAYAREHVNSADLPAA